MMQSVSGFKIMRFAPNMVGLVVGMALSAFLNESFAVKKILQGQVQVDIDLSSIPPPAVVDTQSRKLQERLDNCAQQLDQVEARILSSSPTADYADHNSNSTTTLYSETAAICAIQKGGLFYIDEFVDYHLALGFQTIYIYDNSDDFELQQWANYRNPEQIVVYHFPGDRQQVPAYQNCLAKQKMSKSEQLQQKRQLLRNNNNNNNKNGSKPKPKQYIHDWLAFIDIDEFIVLKEARHNNNIINMLQDTLPSDKAGLALGRETFFFNESQISYKPGVPLTKRFQMRLNDINTAVKMIAKTSQILKPDVHFISYRGNKQLSVDTLGNQVTAGLNQRKTMDVAVVHHYQTKSLEEFRWKCARGDAVFGKYVEGQGERPKGNQVACRSEQELLQQFRAQANSTGETFDDRAWQFLYNAVPKYRRYNKDV